MTSSTATASRGGDSNKGIFNSTPEPFPARVIARNPRPTANRQNRSGSAAGDPTGLRSHDRGERGRFGQRCRAPGIVIGKQRCQQLPRVSMAGADATKMPDDRPAGKVKTAARVKNLWPANLAAIAQPAAVKPPAPADDHDIVERAAATKPRRM